MSDGTLCSDLIWTIACDDGSPLGSTKVDLLCTQSLAKKFLLIIDLTTAYNLEFMLLTATGWIVVHHFLMSQPFQTLISTMFRDLTAKVMVPLVRYLKTNFKTRSDVPYLNIFTWC